MAVQKLITRVLIPGGTAATVPSLVPLIRADEDYAEGVEFVNECPDELGYVGYQTKPVSETYVCPEDLPIYDDLTEDNCDQCVPACEPDPSQLQQGVSKMRETVMSSVDSLKLEENRDKFLHNIDVGLTRMRHAYEHLSREENYLSRAAAISTGGLMGLLMARRGGIIKRVFYASAGLAAAASICYPKQAVIITDDLYKIGKYYAFVAYQQIQEAGKKNAAVDDSACEQNCDNMDTVAEQASDVNLYGFRINEKPKQCEPDE